MAKKNKLAENIPKDQPTPAETTGGEDVIAENSGEQSVAPNYKKWFFISLAVMLGLLWVSGFNVGLCSDEMDMNQYGKANYSYYFSGGKDTSFLNLHQGTDTIVMKTLPYYGSNFEYIATGINYLTGNIGGRQEYNVRHALNQLFVVLTILFAGLCTARISNFRAALIVSWLLFLSPTFIGWGLFDTKDLPFCAGYIATLYFMIRFLEQLPRPTWKATLYLMLAFAFTMGIRVGGLLLLFYFILFAKIVSLSTKQMRTELFHKSVLPPLILKVLTVMVGGLTITILLWPYALMHPVHNLIEAINSAKMFPTDIKMNFKGVEIRSTELPQNYLLTYLTITIPVFILVAFCCSVILLATNFRRIKVAATCLILLAALFPIFYGIQSGMALYNGWRHILFFYPAFIIITGLGIERILDAIKKPAMQLALISVCLLAMAHPIYWSIKNHPYEYMYYNETEGFGKAYYDYETDVWTISVLPAVDWLMKNEHLADRKDTVIVGSNAALFVRHHINTHYPGSKIKVIATSGKNCWTLKWDYMLLNTIFLSTNYLQNDYPPEGMIHSIDVGGQPVTAIVKDTLHLQYNITDAILHNRFPEADSLANVYLKMTRKINTYMYGSIAVAKARTGHFDEGRTYGNKAVLNNPDDLFGHSALSFISYKQNNLYDAADHITICLSIAPTDPFILQLADSISAKIPK